MKLLKQNLQQKHQINGYDFCNVLYMNIPKKVDQLRSKSKLTQMNIVIEKKMNYHHQTIKEI